jgi:predicted secreted protein
MFFVVEPRRHRSAGAPQFARKDLVMTSNPRFDTRAVAATCIALLMMAAQAAAQPAPPFTMPPHLPSVTLSAAATASVPNDRMLAWMRAEADNADAAAAAAVVNARMAKALALAKSAKGVEASTSGYSSQQFAEKNQPARWRVAQTLKLESSDFTSLSALITQLQAEGGLVVDGTQFSVSNASRRNAEDSLTQQAIKSWQARAAEAARGFGFDGWRVGNVAIQTGESFRPQPVMRAMAFEAKAAPVAMEAGNSDITVTVSGDAVLEAPRPPSR